MMKHNAVRYAVATLLLVTGGAKVAGLQLSAVPQVGELSRPWIQLSAAQWEIALGLWLLCGVSRFSAWRATVGTFLLFAMVSGYLEARGVSACGCFGEIDAEPWQALVVDLLALALLLTGWPQQSHRDVPAKHQAEGRRATAGVLRVVVVAATALGAVAAFGFVSYGSITVALAKLRGETVTTATTYLDFGYGSPGEVMNADLKVFNYTENTVKILGGSSGCSCTTLNDLPVTVEPNSATTITIELRVPSHAERGTLTRNAILRTDSPARRILSFRIGCRVE